MVGDGLKWVGANGYIGLLKHLAIAAYYLTTLLNPLNASVFLYMKATLTFNGLINK